MARQARLTVAGATYHVFARGNRRQEIYTDDFDRQLFLRILGDAVAAHELRCVAYCLLTNHFHLVVRSPRTGTDLSAGMHRLNSRYAQWFNQRHGLVGHLFQGRFTSRLVEREGQLLSTLRYVFRNPVKAGLCSEPEDWPWSSYAATLGTAARPGFLSSEDVLALFASDPAHAAQGLSRFLRDTAA